jgi:hypothetical protein
MFPHPACLEVFQTVLKKKRERVEINAISVVTQDITLPLEGVTFQQTYIHQQQDHQDCQLLNLSHCQYLVYVAYCCKATD